MRLFLLSLPLWAWTLPLRPAEAKSAAPAPVAKAAVAKPAPAISDQTLQARIQEKFSKSKAGGGKFTVRVERGTAILSGKAEVVQHKGAATRMAKAAGAKSVRNEIVVSEAARQKAAKSLERGRARPAVLKSNGD